MSKGWGQTRRRAGCRHFGGRFLSEKSTVVDLRRVAPAGRSRTGSIKPSIYKPRAPRPVPWEQMCRTAGVRDRVGGLGRTTRGAASFAERWAPPSIGLPRTIPVACWPVARPYERGRRALPSTVLEAAPSLRARAPSVDELPPASPSLPSCSSCEAAALRGCAASEAIPPAVPHTYTDDKGATEGRQEDGRVPSRCRRVQRRHESTARAQPDCTRGAYAMPPTLPQVRTRLWTPPRPL